MNLENVDRVIAYCLAAAGREDPGEQELGPIHIVKYVYLADLVYAKRHDGETYTGVRWKFHKFGPWSPELLERIEPVAAKIGADRREFSSKYDTDSVRWRKEDSDLFDELRAALPIDISLEVRTAIHRFHADTFSLLNHVYCTVPMLKAAPGEWLDLKPEAEAHIAPAEDTPDVPSPSKNQIRRLRSSISEKLSARRLASARPTSPRPRYDAVFEEGQRWLDSLAGAPVEPSEGEAVFADSIWKSEGRREPYLS